MTDFEVWPADRHVRMPWSNGGGWTTEIIAEPSGTRWDWRLSVADVETSGPFSLFPGVDRTIALLRGKGFALAVGGRTEQVIDTAFQPFEFAGDEVTSCRLIDGPVQDLNLMTRRGAVRRRLEFINLAPQESVSIVDVDLMVVLAGCLRVDTRSLQHLDAIRPTSWSQPLTCTASEQGPTVIMMVGDQLRPRW